MDTVFMENWVVIITYAAALLSLIALLGFFYVLKTAIVELHITCDDEYEWPH